MAIAYRSEAHANTAGATSLVVNTPAGVLDDDLLIALLILEGGTAPVTPAGWTALHPAHGGLSGVAFATYYKVAASEGASYTFNWTGSNPAAGMIAAYSGVDPDDPITSAALRPIVSAGSTLSTKANWAAFAGAVDLVIARAYNTSTTVIPPTGYTERADVATANGGSIEISDKMYAAAGAIAERTLTTSASTYAHVASIVLRPAGLADPLQPYVRGFSYNRAAASTSLALPAIHPTPVADDVLVAVAHHQGFTAGGFVVPSGFTQIGLTAAGNGQELGAANHLCTGGETSDVSVGFGVSDELNGLLVHIRGAEVANANSFATAASTATSIGTSLTTLEPKELLVAALFTSGAGAVSTLGAPSSMTAMLTEFNPLDAAGATNGDPVAAASQVQDTAGPSGAKTFTISYTGSHTRSLGMALLAFPYANQPPNAPSQITPVGGAVFDRSLTQRFRWSFSDPNASDSQSAYELRYRVVGDPSWTTVGPVSSPNGYHDFGGGTFTADDFEWQARTYDGVGEVGAWSASAFFTAADPSGDPSIITPIDGSTISTSSATVEWSIPTQESYQLRRVADAGGSPDELTVYFDTGQVVSSATRSLDVTFPVNERWEHVQVRVWDGGLPTGWASVRVEVAYTPPATPNVSLSIEQAGGVDAAIRIEVNNP